MRVEILNTGSELMLGFVTNTRCAGAADDSVTGTLADVVQNVGSMTMMQVRDLALEQAMEIKPIKYKSTQLETATFTGTYTPTESDRFLVMFSDDGYKITVKLGGEEVFKQDALNRGQHLPNVDGNPSATRSLHLLPIVLEKGVTYEIEVVYRNKFYYGATDIDGITVFVVDSATEFEMCSAVCAPAGGMKPTTAVGDPHDVHIRARVDTDGRTRTYKVTFRAHNPPNGLVRVDDIEVEDLDGGLPILFFQKGTLNNHATFSVSSQVLPGAPNMLTKRLQVTVHFKGVNPGSVTLSFYDKRTEKATDTGWELLRKLTAADERQTWLVGTGVVTPDHHYMPVGGGTVEVIAYANLGTGVAHNIITTWPKSPENEQWPKFAVSPSDAGTWTTVVNGHGTASTVFGARPDFVGVATLKWTTGTSSNECTVTVWKPEITNLSDVVLASPQSTIVGKKIQLKARGTPTSVAVDSYTWVTTNDPIKNYTQTTGTGVVSTWSTSDFINQQVGFYWIKGGTAVVTCTITVGGHSRSASLTFEIARPTATLLGLTTSNTPPVNVGNNGFVAYNTLHFGTNGAAGQVGIKWDGFATTPAGGAGEIQFCQLVKTHRRFITDGDVHQKISSANSFVHDSPTPYGGLKVTIGSGLTGSISRDDSPASGVPGNRRISVDDHYKIFLMYKPDGADSI